MRDALVGQERKRAIDVFGVAGPVAAGGNEREEIGVGDGDGGLEGAVGAAIAGDGEHHAFGVVLVFGVEERVGPVARVEEQVGDVPVGRGFDHRVVGVRGQRIGGLAGAVPIVSRVEVAVEVVAGDVIGGAAEGVAAGLVDVLVMHRCPAQGQGGAVGGVGGGQAVAASAPEAASRPRPAIAVRTRRNVEEADRSMARVLASGRTPERARSPVAGLLQWLRRLRRCIRSARCVPVQTGDGHRVRPLCVLRRRRREK